MASGISSNAQANLGKQLSSRVASGAITQRQAQQTAAQRQTLAKVYGPDWRTKVFGKGGAQGIEGPFARVKIAAKRNQALQRAKNGYPQPYQVKFKKGTEQL